MINPKPRLSDQDFAHIVRHAPLVSIDLIIKDPQGMALLGLRENEPARGSYFAPGGVIRKNETIKDAFSRILLAEIGCQGSIDDARFMGVFEHFYERNRFGDPGFGTHYVVLGYEITFDPRPQVTVDSQHSAAVWMSATEIVSSGMVHPYTKAYFV